MTEVDDERWVLTTDEGAGLLAEAGAFRTPGPADLARWRKGATPGRVAAALRIAEARRRAAPKFTKAGAMWLTPTGVEQATAEPVAAAKARRFPAGPIVDLCSGIGGDAIALAAVGRVLAVDRDPAMAARLAWNAAVFEVSDCLLPVVGDASRPPSPPSAWVHADPDRRSGRPRAGRAARLDGYVPGLPTLLGLVRHAPGGAIKLGPASDFDDAFAAVADRIEVEVVSLNGECKEATVWFGAGRACRRRATVLPDGATWTDRDGPAGVGPMGALGDWLLDPDPALSRSGLLDAFAAAHGLWRVAAGVPLLTGPMVVSPFLTPFRVVGVYPLDLKTLRREVATRGIGALEIKPRGVDLTPEAARARLRPEGDRPATLFLIGGRSAGRAVLAERAKDG